ncbi:DUF6537 domain-containing protein [Actinokineospora pegani]|uniref:DUF6537 domain-containing protein n=1 Tax=Actinokineospora pegani TaxID=2654637 RepID=UPI0012E99852|nr:DUF6537 domain-containing protein [Actinokineospora pegani]
MRLDQTGPTALTGVAALGRLLLDQRAADAARGWRTAGLVSGYRGAPLGGLDLLLQHEAALFAKHGIEFVPGVNEELGATVVYGSQLAPQLPGARHEGVFGLWYGRAPGLDRSSDAVKHGTWMGTAERGGVLAVVGDDPASRSSSLPSASAMALAESYLPVLAPADVADVLRLGRIGIEMSRFTGSWTGFTVVTDVADACERVELGAPVRVAVPEFGWEGGPWAPTRHPGVDAPLARAMEREVLAGRLAAAEAFAAANGVDEVIGSGTRLGIIAAGHDYTCLREALDGLGLTGPELDRRGVRLLKLGMVHPLDRVGLAAFASGLAEVVVVEAKRPFVEAQVKEVLYNLAERPRVWGKQGPAGPLVPVDGVLDADRLRECLGPLLADRVGASYSPPARQPRVELPSPRPAPSPFTDSGFTQLGGEGAPWVGAAPFTDTPHLFQNMGDGAFSRSGQLAVRQAVAARTTVTFTFAHTPAGNAVDPAATTRLLHAEGVARTVVVTDDPGRYPRGVAWAPGVRVRGRVDLNAVQRELRAVPGVTVLILDQHRACDCATGSTSPHSCPSSVQAPPTTRAVEQVEIGPLPEPVRPARANIVMVGTGVVTANHVLTTAAVLDGLPVRALDQTAVSHQRVATGRTGQVPAGLADAYLVLDTPTAATEPALSRCSTRTSAVISTPDPAATLITSRVASCLTFDAPALATRILDDPAATPFLVLGAAYQEGLLPQSAEAIESAITHNGVAVDTTLLAFRAGRRKALDPTWPPPAGVDAPEQSPATASFPTTLRAVVDPLYQDLAAFQSRRYAQRYLTLVAEVAATDTEVASAVAVALHKLMAHKDEYELARLHLTADHPRGTTYRLHPPTLRALGLGPLTLRHTARPLFTLLRTLRFLRQTPLDPFAHTRLRRLERQVLREYTALVPRLATLPASRALPLAALPNDICDYGPLKHEAIACYRTRQAQLVAELDPPSLPVG